MGDGFQVWANRRESPWGLTGRLAVSGLICHLMKPSGHGFYVNGGLLAGSRKSISTRMPRHQDPAPSGDPPAEAVEKSLMDAVSGVSPG